MDARLHSHTTIGFGRGAGPAVRARDRLIARWRSFALDRDLASGVPADESPALQVRARALLEPGTRRELGRSVRRILRRGSHPPTIGGRVAVHRDAVAEAHDDLDLLARRLLDAAPVPVRGVAKARVLLSDGSSPLYWSRGEDALREQVRGAIEALGPGTPDEPAAAGGKDAVR
jgi:hypothetical protein